MNKALSLVILILLLLSSLLYSCDSLGNEGGEEQPGNTDSAGDAEIEESGDDKPAEPQPFNVYVKNEAGWSKIYCCLYNEDDVFLCKIELSYDLYGIYYATLGAECEYFYFTDGGTERTGIHRSPSLGHAVLNNESEEWTAYDTAIKNSIYLGENSIAVTERGREEGREYILFYADRDGIYTFITDSDLDVKIVTVPYDQGNWEEDSTDWNAFSDTDGEAYLIKGYYYACISYSADLPNGLYSLTLGFSEYIPESVVIDNAIFTNGSIWVYFFNREGSPIMVVLSENGTTHDYSYVAEQKGDKLLLRVGLISDGEEFFLGTAPLSAISQAGKLYVVGDTMTVKDVVLTIPS